MAVAWRWAVSSERPILSVSSREMFDTCKSLRLSLFERQEATIWSRIMLSVCVSNSHVPLFVVGCTMSRFPRLVLEHNSGIRIARKQRCFEMKNIAWTCLPGSRNLSPYPWDYLRRCLECRCPHNAARSHVVGWRLWCLLPPNISLRFSRTSPTAERRHLASNRRRKVEELIGPWWRRALPTTPNVVNFDIKCNEYSTVRKHASLLVPWAHTHHPAVQSLDTTTHMLNPLFTRRVPLLDKIVWLARIKL